MAAPAEGGGGGGDRGENDWRERKTQELRKEKVKRREMTEELWVSGQNLEKGLRALLQPGEQTSSMLKHQPRPSVQVETLLHH